MLYSKPDLVTSRKKSLTHAAPNKTSLQEPPPKTRSHSSPFALLLKRHDGKPNNAHIER